MVGVEGRVGPWSVRVGRVRSDVRCRFVLKEDSRRRDLVNGSVCVIPTTDFGVFIFHSVNFKIRNFTVLLQCELPRPEFRTGTSTDEEDRQVSQHSVVRGSFKEPVSEEGRTETSDAIGHGTRRLPSVAHPDWRYETRRGVLYLSVRSHRVGQSQLND